MIKDKTKYKKKIRLHVQKLFFLSGDIILADKL